MSVSAYKVNIIDKEEEPTFNSSSSETIYELINPDGQVLCWTEKLEVERWIRDKEILDLSKEDVKILEEVLEDMNEFDEVMYYFY